jgi:hypothetical protein
MSLDYESIISIIILSVIVSVSINAIIWFILKRNIGEGRTTNGTLSSEKREQIKNTIETLKSEITKQKTSTQHQMKIREINIDQLTQQLKDHIDAQTKINEELFRSIEFIHTFFMGPEAKSLPPYMYGEEETQEHRDLPEVGMFREDES